jgi:hypothetical protein
MLSFWRLCFAVPCLSIDPFVVLALSFLASFWFDRLRFVQAMLTEHSFGKNSLEDTTMLQGHNQTLALPSDSVQELLTAEALITALMLAAKQCQAILHFSRLITAENAPMPSWGPQTDHALPTSRSEYGINFQETVPCNSDSACNRTFSSIGSEEKVEAPGSVIACTISAIPKLRKAKKLDESSFLRQSPNADAEAIHQGAKCDGHVRDPSFAGTRQDLFCRNKDVVHLALWPFHESTVPYLDHCSSDGNGTLPEVLDCSTCDVDESAMENGSSVLWTRQR